MMRATLLLLLFSATASGVDCTLRPENQGSHLDQWTGPLQSVGLQPLRQSDRFSPELWLSQGEGPIVLELEYCGGFDLAGDFSQLPIWEFGGVGWAMIQNPDDEDSLLGNFLGPPPAGFETLRDPVTWTQASLDDHVFRTTGVFDTTGLEAGRYVIGLTGTYVFAEPSTEDPELRVRMDLNFEHGFPVIIKPVPELSTVNSYWLSWAVCVAAAHWRRPRKGNS